MKKNKSNNDDFEDVQKNLNWAIETATTDWVLRIDADEVVTPELQEEIKDIIGQSQIKSDKIGKETDSIRLNPVSSDYIVAYGIPRQQNFLGTFLKGGDWAYDRLVRLFRPKFCRYDPIVKVHEQFKVNGKIGYLKNSLLHYSHPDKKTLFKKFDSYTNLESQQLKETKLSAFLKLIFVPPYIFLRWMLYHHGYKDGWIGMQAGIMRAYYDALLYYKFIRN